MDWCARLRRIWAAPWLAEGLAFLGGVVYAIQSWIYAHTQSSVLDEGAYLLKGYLFATGKYFPFQDYGPWSNHMPFSFLIPGYIQVLFGPGLRTGRYFAILLGVLTLLGIWLLARRLGNRWWGVAAVWLLALNIPLIKTFSVMASQGLVACIFVWVLALTLGPRRPTWQVMLGVALSGLMMMTRLNMTPVLPFLILYIFWEYGKKVGLWSLVVGVLVLGVGHAIFWPGILRLWVAWLPLEWIPFFETWAKPEGALPNWNPDVSISDRIMSFFQGIRIQFFAIVGALLAWIYWPSKDKWRSAWRFRTGVFLSALLGILFIFHLWASLGKNYCVFCFSTYLSFFSFLGILLVILAFSSWEQFTNRFGKWVPSALILALSAGVGYSAKKIWANQQTVEQLARDILRIEVPRFSSLRIQPGTVELWSLFANKFGWAEVHIFSTTTDLLRAVIPIFLGLIIGLVLLRFGSVWWDKIAGADRKNIYSPNAGIFTLFLLLGTVVSLGLGLSPGDRDCGWDVIASYEAGGAHLAEYIPAGSKVYWWGGLSTVPLLYLPDVEIYPPQINNGYSFRLGGDPDDLARYGWWSRELAEQWIQEADVILIEARLHGGFATSFVESEAFDEVSPTPPLVPCRSNSPIHIFLREQ
ncbi:MAG: glycosyltransferase family 39 protein [Anaerolineales bacterium]|nr:glycosyltransferase family 39 protein [Anaerolineales bacterium]